MNPSIQARVAKRYITRQGSQPEFKDELDKLFYEYALEERRFPNLSPEQKTTAKRNYGGVHGVINGTIYSGGRIDTLDKLHQLKDIANGGTLNVKVQSFSHLRSTAQSFANFVMTYDDAAGSRAMARALERGSAGKFGTYIIHAKADPQTILFNTRRPNGVSRHAEDELIVDGQITVTKVELFEPLNLTNWVANTVDTWTDVRDIAGQAFLHEWLRKNNIQAWPVFAAFLKRTIRSAGDLGYVLLNSNLFELYGDEFEKWVAKSTYATMLVDELKSNIVNDTIRFSYKGAWISLGKSLYEIALKRHTDVVFDTYNKTITEFYNSLGKAKQVVHKERITGMDEFVWSDLTYDFLSVATNVRSLESIGMFKREHLDFLRDYSQIIEYVGGLGFTPTNWRMQLSIMRELARIELGPIAELDARLAAQVATAFRNYGQHIYAVIHDQNFLNGGGWVEIRSEVYNELREISSYTMKLMSKH